MTSKTNSEGGLFYHNYSREKIELIYLWKCSVFIIFIIFRKPGRFEFCSICAAEYGCRVRREVRIVLIQIRPLVKHEVEWFKRNDVIRIERNLTGGIRTIQPSKYLPVWNFFSRTRQTKLRGASKNKTNYDSLIFNVNKVFKTRLPGAVPQLVGLFLFCIEFGWGWTKLIIVLSEEKKLGWVGLSWVVAI